MFTNMLSVLYIGQGSDIAAEVIRNKSQVFKCITLEESGDLAFIDANKNAYDFILSMGALEYARDPVLMLKNWKKMLNKSGTLLLGMNNRMGIRFFCGEEDPYTGTRFDGIENYLRLSDDDRVNMLGKCYGRHDIECMLKQSGYDNFKRYSVYPCLEEPQLVYADGVYPNENLAVRYFPKYHDKGGVFLEEEYMMDDLVDNGLFHQMANAFVFECSMGELSRIQHLTFSIDRGRKDALVTIISSDGTVTKTALYEEGVDKIKILHENHRQLLEAGINIAATKIKDDKCITTFIAGVSGDVYMKHLLYTDTDAFLERMDRFRDIIYKSSRWVMEDEKLGPILEKGYLDLVPLNCIYHDGEFEFFDQEFVENMYPAKAILYRAVSIIYWGHIYDQNVYPYDKILERYGLLDKAEHWEYLCNQFTQRIHKDGCKELTGQYHLRDNEILKQNRQAIAYSNATYLSMFEDIFGDIYDKKVYVFGTGEWAEFFIDMYKNDVDIICILDNNSVLWEKESYGYKVMSPKILAHMDPNDYKVFVCVEEYKYIVEQIKILGARNIAVFNRYKVYPGRRTAYISKTYTNNGQVKKYHIGYIAGVFDLFNVGHLDILRRAKEQCDYLVAGVFSDEQVRRDKHKEPFVPFKERVEIVRSCRYVDEVAEIPLDFSGTEEAFQKYHFDVQFSVSDHINDTWWLEQKLYLESQGVEIV